MILPLALLLLGAAPPAVEATLDAGLAAHPAGAARAIWASGLLRGAAYAPSPLGEGSGPDPDPRFRLDRFDCQTLVETALALGAVTRVADAVPVLDDIRYSGAPSFARRNHYVESQWLPALAAKGYAEDVTVRLAGERAREETLVLTAERWLRAGARGRVVPGLPAEALPVGSFPVRFVPLAEVAALPSLPPGTIVLVVRTDRPDRPFRVTHMGILVEEGGVRSVRHASPLRGKVVDEPLDRFVRRLAAERGWRVAGLGFWSIRDGR